MTTSMDVLAREIDTLKRQVAALSSPQLAYSSLHDSAVHEYETVLDGDGNVVTDQVTSVFGRQYDGTHGIVAVAGPTPPTPIGVTVEPVPNGIIVRWQGEYQPLPPPSGSLVATPVVAPLDFLQAEVHADTEADFSALFFDTLRGYITSARGGELFIPVSPDIEVYVRLVVRTSAGKKSLASAPVGPVAGGLIPATAVDIDLSGIGEGNTIHRGDTAPAGEHKVGDFWLQTPENIAHRWEGDPADWVDTRDTGIAEALDKAFEAAAAAEQAGIDALAAKDAAAGKIELYKQASPPEGDIPDNYLWIDSDDNQLYVRVAGAWQASQDAAIGAAVSAAATAQAVADGKMRIFPQDSPPSGLTADDAGDLWIETDDGNRPWTWSGTAWEDRRFGNAAIQPQSLVASDVIVTGTVTGGLLKADAIDGKTITGATIRTAGGGQRIQIDSINGLQGIAADGTTVVTQVGTDGSLVAINATISGTLRTAATGPRIEMLQTANNGLGAAGSLKFYSGLQGAVPAGITHNTFWTGGAGAATMQGHSTVIESGESNEVGPKLKLNVEELAAGGYRSVARLESVDALYITALAPGIPKAMTRAQRVAWPTVELPPHCEVYETDTKFTVRWDGAQWVKVAGPPTLVCSTLQTGQTQSSNNGVNQLVMSATVTMPVAGTVRGFWSTMMKSDANAAMYMRTYSPSNTLVAETRHHNNGSGLGVWRQITEYFEMFLAQGTLTFGIYGNTDTTSSSVHVFNNFTVRVVL